MRSEEFVGGILLALFLGSSICAAPAEGAASMVAQCTNELTKTTDCLGYERGKVAEPTKQCCSSMMEIKSSHPVCLCYLIILTHNGSEQIKSLGIQEARLLQLPSACKWANASFSDCPKLLNIPPSSPSYGVFTGSSSSSVTPASKSGTSSPANSDVSDGSNPRPNFAANSFAMAVAPFLVRAFSAGGGGGFSCNCA